MFNGVDLMGLVKVNGIKLNGVHAILGELRKQGHEPYIDWAGNEVFIVYGC